MIVSESTLTDIRTPEAELAALKEFVESDGWRVYQAHVDVAWGAEACLDAIDKAISKDVAPDEELAVTKRIRDTFKGVRAEARWVPQRIAELEAALKDRRPSAVDRFLGLRRMPR